MEQVLGYLIIVFTLVNDESLFVVICVASESDGMEVMMKLIITADDFGITPAVTDGIVACARDGLLTQTGLFVNMPWAEYAVTRIHDFPHVVLGIDLNICAGDPVTNPKLLPSLIQANGSFLTSKMHRQRESKQKNSVSYDEVYMEFENQILKFKELTGRMPGYIQGHAWGNEDTDKATKELADKFNIKTFTYYMDKYIMREKASFIEGYWAKPKILPDQTKEFSIMTQIEHDPLQMFIDGKLTYLDKALKNEWITELHTHAGYVDRKLFDVSSYTLIRAMEAAFLCSSELKRWVSDHQVELITFRELA